MLKRSLLLGLHWLFLPRLLRGHRSQVSGKQGSPEEIRGTVLFTSRHLASLTGYATDAMRAKHRSMWLGLYAVQSSTLESPEREQSLRDP